MTTAGSTRARRQVWRAPARKDDDMRTAIRAAVAVVVGAAMLLIASPASAATIWTPANAGTTVSAAGVVTLDTTNALLTPLGTSLETTDLDMAIETGDLITFEYMLGADVACGGGQPRVFIMVNGVIYNTFDLNPNQCGTDANNDGWFTVTYTYTGPSGDITAAGIVVDNPSDRGVIMVRNLTIGGEAVDLLEETPPAPPTNKDQCKNGGWVAGGFTNQGQCVSSFVRHTH
jgi:hypothetical protein